MIWTRNDEMVRVLVEHGADVNARGSSGDLELPDWFLTPLWRAAHDGRLASIRLLVERGARLDVKDTIYRATPLGWAMHAGRNEIASYLRDLGPGTV